MSGFMTAFMLAETLPLDRSRWNHSRCLNLSLSLGSDRSWSRSKSRNRCRSRCQSLGRRRHLGLLQKGFPHNRSQRLMEL